jgi:hypothetical protein
MAITDKLDFTDICEYLEQYYYHLDIEQKFVDGELRAGIKLQVNVHMNDGSEQVVSLLDSAEKDCMVSLKGKRMESWAGAKPEAKHYARLKRNVNYPSAKARVLSELF